RRVLFRSVGLGEEVDVGLAEYDEEVAFAGVFEVLRHVQVGVHAGLEHGNAAELVELGGVGLVVEGAGNQYVEAAVAGLACGGDEVGALHGAKLGADEDGGASFGVTFAVTAFAAGEAAGARDEGFEGDAVGLVGLLHAGGAQVFQDHLGEGLLGTKAGRVFVGGGVDEAVVFVHAKHAVGAEALDGEGAGHTDGLFVLVGLVV